MFFVCFSSLACGAIDERRQLQVGVQFDYCTNKQSLQAREQDGARAKLGRRSRAARDLREGAVCSAVQFRVRSCGTLSSAVTTSVRAASAQLARSQHTNWPQLSTNIARPWLLLPLTVSCQ